MQTTEDLIRPIIEGVYGNGMGADLVLYLAPQIDKWPNTDLPHYGSETREDYIRHTCWMWCSGGGTAAGTAAKIEAALKERENEQDD
jgi:hypothetical protein